MRDYDPTTGRYLQADPLGLVDGASVYGYARQNPGRWIDPRGEQGLSTPGVGPGGGLGIAGGVAPGTGLGDALGQSGPDALSALLELSHNYNPIDLALQTIMANGSMPYSHEDETDAINFMLDPFGDGNYCERLRRAINILRANIPWRISDLQPKTLSYSGHLTRIALLKYTLKKLEANYRSVCGGECPPE
jgi:hypothetical protein